MKHFLLSLFFLLTLQGFAQTIDLSAYNEFLKDHVDKDGVVDYDKLVEDMDVIHELARNFSKISPNAGWSANEQKAFWINYYNVNIIKLLVENYPIKSINYITEPFKSETLDFTGGKISLDFVEHSILRKFDDPRVHFALYSTATSSPLLKRTAYEAKSLDYELDMATKAFINDETKNDINLRGSKISRIFEWYKEDFELVPFINKFSNTGKISTETPISYMDYNWNLHRE